MTDIFTAARDALIGDRKVNDLKQWGIVVAEPSFVLEAVTNGSGSDPFGTSGEVSVSDIDFLFHKAKNVTLAEQTDYYESNEVKANVYHINDGEMVRSEFVREDGEWMLNEAAHTYDGAIATEAGQ